LTAHCENKGNIERKEGKAKGKNNKGKEIKKERNSLIRI